MKTRFFSLFILVASLVLVSSPVGVLAQKPILTPDDQTNGWAGLTAGQKPTQSVELVGQIGGSSYAIAVEGDYAYIGVGPRLVIVNIADSAHPALIGQTVPLPDVVRDVAVAGSYAYVADYYGGLRVIDVANPAAPDEVGAHDTPGSARGVAVAGSYAYVADWDGGLRMINVANSTAPVEVGAYEMPGYAWSVAVAGSYAYVADIFKGLRVIDVANPAAPVEVGVYVTPGATYSVAVAGSYVYVADADGGLLILRFNDRDQRVYLPLIVR